MKEKHGDKIAGSRFYRVYCKRCEEPMRVDFWDLDKGNYCESCAPRKPPDRPATKDDDAGPWYDNALRAYEEQQ